MPPMLCTPGGICCLVPCLSQHIEGQVVSRAAKCRPYLKEYIFHVLAQICCTVSIAHQFEKTFDWYLSSKFIIRSPRLHDKHIPVDHPRQRRRSYFKRQWQQTRAQRERRFLSCDKAVMLSNKSPKEYFVKLQCMPHGRTEQHVSSDWPISSLLTWERCVHPSSTGRYYV